MSVILTILKILGILIAVLIGIVLLAAALVLFVPVRYRISGTIEEDKNIKAEFFWLLHVLSFRAVYAGGDFESSFRIFGLQKKKKDKAPDSGNAQEEERGGTQEEERGDAASAAGDIQKSEDSPDNGKQLQTGEIQEDESPPKDERSGRRRPRGHRIAGIIDKAKTVRQKFLQLIDRVAHMRQTGKEFWHTIVTESNRIAASYIGKELVYLLRHLRFRRWKADLVFSLGDPALTGQVLGGLATLPFLYQKGVQICPDFASDLSYLRGDFSIRGHLRLIHVLCSFLRLICKKECRNLVKSLK